MSLLQVTNLWPPFTPEGVSIVIPVVGDVQVEIEVITRLEITIEVTTLVEISIVGDRNG